MISCGSESLEYFIEKAAKNATYTSLVAVVEFVEAIGIWVEEVVLERLRKPSFYRIMADECTNITTVEELSIHTAAGWKMVCQ